MKVYKTEIPADSLTRQFFPVDYTDAFACKVKVAKKLSADDMQIALWTVMPKWVKALFKLRNILVRPFGLRTEYIENRNEKLENMIRHGDGSVEGMSLAAKTENETVLLLNDSHLDAYVSIHIARNGESQTMTTITLVKYRNTFGRVYFFFIKPFHKIVIKAEMKSNLKKVI